MNTTTTAVGGLELATIEPANLTVGDQAREDATPDDELIASVQAHGILQPPLVEINGDGEWVIVAGHRRVGAAIAAGLTEITVLVRRRLPGDEGAITLEQQIVENERRKQLSAKDLANGYQRLTLFGLRPEDIAAQLGETADRVRAGLRIHKSGRAAELVASDPTIDLERAAQIADFDDHPKLQEKLVETATTAPQNFDRDLANARTQREVDGRVATLKTQLENDDVTLVGVSNYDDWYWRGKDGKGRLLDKVDIRPEEHLGCPGHAALIHKAQSYYLNLDPAEWLVYVCTDWEGNGHEIATATGPTLTPEEEAERDERERARAAAAEEWKAKQELITANTTARQTWIHQHITTGRLRPVVAHFDLQALALAAQTEASDFAPVHVALTLITGTPHTRDWSNSDNDDHLVLLATDPATPSARVVIAHAFAALEDALRSRFAVKYFDILTTLGYTLTDTDQEHLAEAVTAQHEWEAEQAGEDLTGDPREDDDTDDEEDDQ